MFRTVSHSWLAHPFHGADEQPSGATRLPAGKPRRRDPLQRSRRGDWFERLVAVAVLASTGSCSNQVVPRQPPSATELGAGFGFDWPVARTSQPGPLEILLAMPQGAVERPTEVAIVFDRPIRPSEGVDEGPLGFSIEPALAGTWSWVGTHGVVFEPLAHEFPRATAYQVRIADELTAVDGTRLAQTWSQRFETPHPQVALSDCAALTAAPGGWLSVTTEPPVDEAELKRALHVEVASLPEPARGLEKLDLGAVAKQTSASTPTASTPTASLSGRQPVYRPLAFTLQREPSGQAGYRILPRQTWPVLSQVRVRVDAGVRSKEGPNPSDSAVERSCRTVGLPYAEAAPGQLESHDGRRLDTVYLDFPNPPNEKAILAGIRVTPTARVRASTNERSSSSGQDRLARAPNAARTFRPIRIELTELRPSTEYQVTIAPGLSGAFGGRTRYAQRIAITTARAARSVVAGIESGQFEPDRLEPIEVVSSGVEQFEHAAAALTPEQLLGIIEETPAASSSLAAKLLSDAWKAQTVTPPANVPLQRDSRHSTKVELRSLFEPRLSGGAVLYSVRADDAASSRPHWLSISELALTAKSSRYGGMVWVTGLRDAQPRPGVAVYALHARGRKELGRTGRDGSLPINASGFLDGAPSDSATRAALLADDGNQWTLLPLEHAQTTASRGSTSAKPERPLLAVFTDRRAYLGGENVFVKGYVHRQTAGKSLPVRDFRVRVRLLYGSDSKPTQTLSETIVPSNAYGGFTTQFTLPEELPRAAYLIQASADDATAEAPMVVSNPRSVDFEARTESPEAMVTRQPAPFVIRGRYRSGEVMRGARVEWSTQLEPIAFTPSGSERYVTSARALLEPLGSDPASPIAFEATPSSHDARLGDDGKCEVPVSVERELMGPHRLRLEAKIFDVGRNVSSSEAETVVHPAAYYLGLRSISEPVVGQPFAVAVRDFDLEGRAIGGRPVDVLLLRRMAGSAATGDETGHGPGLSKPVSWCRLSSAMTERSCSLIVPEPGIYVVHAVSNDELGRKAHAAMTVFAREASADIVPTPSAGQVSVSRSDASRTIGLLLDRSAYHRGDKARLFVHSPFARANAIVTLEGAGVHFGVTRQVGRTSEFEIPVSESAGPGVYASVLLLREPGRTTAQISNPGANEPVLAQSVIPLPLAADEWRLEVEVKPHKPELLPGSSLVCDVTVRDRHARPQKAELTLWAVDEQALSRSAYHAPDLLGTFAKPRELLTATYDSRSALGWLRLPGSRGSASVVNVLGAVSTASGSPSTRCSAPSLATEPERGAATVVFLPEVLTDEQGHARIEFKAPTRLSSFRILAEAATATGEFGKGEASFSTAMPLAMHTLMPRFVRVEDHFRAGLVLATQPEVSGEASVRVHAEGIELLESSQRTISLLPARSREVLFDFKSRTPGTAKIRFELDAQGERRTVELGIPVLFQQPRQTVALYGETQRARAERMPSLPQAAAAQTQLEVSLSRTPLVGLAQSIEAILEQGHDNTEQLASRLLILGALREFSRNAGARLPADADRQIQRLLAEFVRRQVLTGGYAYHRGGQPSRWLSAYVHWVLARTAATKLPLPAELKLDSNHYLLSARQMMERGESRADGIEERVFALEILSELLPGDRDVANAIDGVLPKQDRLPLFSQAQLLRAVTLQKQQRPHWAEVRESLLTRIVSRLRLMGGRADLEDSATEYPALLDAKDRTLAFVLRALVAQPSPHLMTSSVLRGLVASRKTETWSSTQATAFALTAIAEYQATSSRELASSVGVVWSGNQPLFSASLEGEHWQASSGLPWHERLGQQPLVFEQRGNGTLFYAARLRYVPAPVQRGASSTAFELTHSIAAAHDGDVAFVEKPVTSEVHLCLGDFVRGELQVFSSRTRHHLMVDVPLPAGLEPVQLGEDQIEQDAGAARAAASPFDRSYHTRIEQDRVRFYVELMKPGQLRFRYSARATILGSFVLPPARVEEQYNPDQFAVTPASRAIITPR